MSLLYAKDDVLLFNADTIELIDNIPENIIQTVITSPTYWGKRQFTQDKREFGRESLEDYVEKNVALYLKILEKLKKEGSLFIIIQDSYMGSGVSRAHHNHWEKNLNPEYVRNGLHAISQGNTSAVTAKHPVIQNKSLCGIPFRIAIKLVDSGYIWREMIIWEKPNPMPENVRDRVRQSCEYILHFTKNRIYTFNTEPYQITGKSGRPRMSNQVWKASSEPKPGHTATFPSKIVEKLLLASSNEGDVVFEPFLGSGTMYDLSIKNGRRFIGCDISKALVEKLIDRINNNNQRRKADLIKTTKTSMKPLSQVINAGNLKLTEIIDQTKEINEILNKKQEFFDKFITKFIEFFSILSKEMKLQVKTNINASLKHDGKTYQFNAIIDLEGTKISLVIPSMSGFDENKGAGAYYASKRINKALNEKIIRGAVLFLPINSRKGKYLEIINSSDNRILPVKLSQEKADHIVKGKVSINSLDLSNDLKNWVNNIVKVA
ncbi:MAG: DNA-methyltransferase [Candidatus Hodarchaeales archaeon]